MASATCKTCDWERATGRVVDETMSGAAWAREIGIDESSIRRHRSHAPTIAQSSGFITPDGIDTLLESIDVPAEFVTTRGMSLRDPITGSWQKVTWQPNRKALHDSLRYDDLREALDGYDILERLDTRHVERADVFAMSDLQIGKAMQRGGGTPETLARIRRSISRYVAELESLTDLGKLPKYIVIWDGGDPIENCWNTPEQAVTNDLPLPEQIRVARRIFLEAIKALAPYCQRLYFVTVPSNHGQHRVGYKAAGGTVDADFGIEISFQLEDVVAENVFLNGRVEFVRPLPLEETAELEVAGTKLAFNHGHRSGSQKTHGTWWAKQSHGRLPGWDADILLTAHYHNMGLTQSGNGRWIIETASSDAGSDWFTYKSGETAVQGVTAFSVRDGEWSNLRVL